jgi:hypothetical protein
VDGIVTENSSLDLARAPDWDLSVGATYERASAAAGSGLGGRRRWCRGLPDLLHQPLGVEWRAQLGVGVVEEAVDVPMTTGRRFDLRHLLRIAGLAPPRDTDPYFRHIRSSAQECSPYMPRTGLRLAPWMGRRYADAADLRSEGLERIDDPRQ